MDPQAANSAPGFRLWHIALPVADLDASLQFYMGTLGFELVGYDECPTKRQAFVSLGADCLTLELFQPRPATQQSLRQRPDHIAFECVDIDASHSRFAAAGLYTPAVLADENGVRSFSIVDPDGTLLEFFQGRALYEQSLQQAVASAC